MQQLLISESVQWAPSKSRRDYVTATLQIVHAMKGDLKMIVTVNLRNSKASYSLLFNRIPVKRLDVNGAHTNKCVDKTAFQNETHKHVFLDECPGLGWAYAPLDISSDDPRIAFDEFCVECGIDFRGQWSPPPTAPLDLDF